jgi:hypothetical protein
LDASLLRAAVTMLRNCALLGDDRFGTVPARGLAGEIGDERHAESMTA